MKSDVDLLGRCKALSRAAMARAADVAEPAAAAASPAPWPPGQREAAAAMLGGFSDAGRAKILAVLDRLPSRRVGVF